MTPTPIYLSYSGRNCEAVLQVMEAIVWGGYGLVCDCSLPNSEIFESRTERMINKVAADGIFVAVVTHDATDCSYMDWELRCALEAKARMLLVVADRAALPPRLQDVPAVWELCHVSALPTDTEMAAVKQCLQKMM